MSTSTATIALGDGGHQTTLPKTNYPFNIQQHGHAHHGIDYARIPSDVGNVETVKVTLLNPIERGQLPPEAFDIIEVPRTNYVRSFKFTGRLLVGLPGSFAFTPKGGGTPFSLAKTNMASVYGIGGFHMWGPAHLAKNNWFE